MASPYRTGCGCAGRQEVWRVFGTSWEFHLPESSVCMCVNNPVFTKLCTYHTWMTQKITHSWIFLLLLPLVCNWLNTFYSSFVCFASIRWCFLGAFFNLEIFFTILLALQLELKSVIVILDTVCFSLRLWEVIKRNVMTMTFLRKGTTHIVRSMISHTICVVLYQ